MLDALSRWPLVRQLTGSAPLGRGAAARSATTADLRPRTAEADRVVTSVCPYCGVGCSQKVFVRDGKAVRLVQHQLHLLDETTFEASPSGFVPDAVGEAASRIVDRVTKDGEGEG